jgi:hypothetical protein
VSVRKWLKAANGTMVSCAMLTALPVEVLPAPPVASELAARLRATSSAIAAAVEEDAVPTRVVPATA